MNMKESKTLHTLLHSLGPKESVYAKQVAYTKDGKKRLTYKYIAGTEEQVWQFIQKGNRTLCEVIAYDRPCHLYIDIDVNKKETPGISAEDCWKQVQPLISSQFNLLFGEGNHSFLIMDSSSSSKGSLHIIVKIKNRLFTNASHCGAYMRVLHEFIKKEHPQLQGAYSFFDLAIYTRNRLFRMLGMTKAGQQRYLKSALDFTFTNWKNTKVCPIDTNGIELIETYEIDGSPPIFSSGFGSGATTVVGGWVPKCVTGEICRHLSDTVGKIQRMIYTGENMRVVCNTSCKDCIFVKRRHKSNVLYIVINLINKTYHIKCHSKHCRNKRSKIIHFSPRLQQIIDDWLNIEVGSQGL